MALIVDIETAGEDYQLIDNRTKEVLTARVRRQQPSKTEAELDREAEDQLGLSPFTGEIIVLGVLDSETGRGAVYYQESPENRPKTAEDQPTDLTAKDRAGSSPAFVYRPTTEAEMIKKFWELAGSYGEFVTFSGRTFDLPFLIVRSLIHRLKPTKDLMRGRYLYQQAPNATHIDLYDQLTFYGAIQAGGLHLACRAFKISTPKEEGIDGSKIGRLYKEGRSLEIAHYNGRDLIATDQLYQYWKRYLAAVS